jgi:hypothetical protein
MRVPPVDVAPLAGLAAEHRQLRLVMLNCYPQLPVEKLKPLAEAGQVYFDFAMAERVGPVARLAGQVSFPRVLFGSHYPLYYFEAAMLKVEESGLSEAQTKAVYEENARRLLGGWASR